MRGVILGSSQIRHNESTGQYSKEQDTRGSRTEHGVPRDTVDDGYRLRYSK